jgi:uncharacterized membrane protein
MSGAGILFTIGGVGFLGMAWLCARGKLRRNPIAGMRTSATMASDAAWFAAHRASAWAIAVDGVVMLGTGLWVALSRPLEAAEEEALGRACVLILVVTVVGGIQAHLVAKRVNRRRARGRRPGL